MTLLQLVPHADVLRLKHTAVLGVFLTLNSVWAQPTPGDISRQLAPARPPELPTLQLQPQRITEPSPVQAGAAVVRVRVWTLQGNQALPTTALQTLLQAFTDVDLSLPQIREAAAMVQQAYEEAGWLARVDVPPQDITEGRVTLQITEARLGQVRMDPNATSRVAPERVQAFVQARQVPGQALNTRHLDRGLLLADDLNGVSLAGTLQAGAQPGTTDVVLSAVAEPSYSLDLSLDNTNARSVGAEKLGLSGIWSSPARFGETYSAQAFKSQGSDYLELAGSAPLGYSGLRGSISLSQLDYRVVTSNDGIRGRSQSAGLDLTYPLLRSRQANVYLNASLEDRRFRGQSGPNLSSDYRTEGGQIGLAGNFFDSLGGGAASSYSLTWRHGQVKDGQMPVNAEVRGGFSKLGWSFSRQQTVNQQVSLFAALNGQNTGGKPLDASENMSLGGPSGVRAYPVGEASGPQGHVANLELRWRLNAEWLITPFYDRGRIEKRPGNVACPALTAYTLEGAGVSAIWSGPRAWVAKATYARRIGANPCQINHKDQDGSLHKDRLWLSVTSSF